MTGVEIKYLSKRLTLYRDEVTEEEAFLREHHQAMLCFEYRELVNDGNNLIGSLYRLDEDWRMKIYKKTIEYDPAFEKVITDLFESWLNTSNRIVALFDGWFKSDYEDRDFDTECIERLRQSCNEVSMMLVPNQEFFSQEKSFKLAEDAVKEHQAGDLPDMETIFDRLD